jgi:hypothetical protein
MAVITYRIAQDCVAAVDDVTTVEDGYDALTRFAVWVEDHIAKGTAPNGLVAFGFFDSHTITNNVTGEETEVD